MSVEQNKASIRRFSEEVINKGNLSAIPGLVAANFVFHMTPEIKGIEGQIQYHKAQKAAMPDYHQVIDQMVAEGDWVATSFTDTGTFTGKFGEMLPTGKKMIWKSSSFCRMENGKQVEVWGYADSLSMYRQLGIPIPPG